MKTTMTPKTICLPPVGGNKNLMKNNDFMTYLSRICSNFKCKAYRDCPLLVCHKNLFYRKLDLIMNNSIKLQNLIFLIQKVEASNMHCTCVTNLPKTVCDNMGAILCCSCLRCTTQV